MVSVCLRWQTAAVRAGWFRLIGFLCVGSSLSQSTRDGKNEEVVSDVVLQIRDWCLTFILNLSTTLSTKAVARSSRVHFENLLYVI